MTFKENSKLPRRKFLQILAAAAPAAWASKLQAQPKQISEEEKQQIMAKRRLPMLQTWADETSALVVVMGARGLRFEAYNSPSLNVQTVHTDDLGNGIILYRLQVSGLTTTAYSQIAIYNQDALKEVRSLKGLDLNQASPNIAVVSCSSYRHGDGQKVMYQRIPEAKTDVVFFIGDIVYANSIATAARRKAETPSGAMSRYIESWRSLDLYQMEPMVPVLAVWDDHDFGMNNGDASNPYKAEMKDIFRSFYPMPDEHENLSYGPGVAFRLTAFGIDFHFLDDRSFQVGKVTQWGDQQEEWFFKDYLSSSRPAWIINGIQFLNYFPMAESVTKNAYPSLQRLKKLMKSHVKPALLVSGDVHYSQIQVLAKDLFGLDTYELTSSAIHSGSAGGLTKRTPEDGQIFFYSDPNFMMVRPQLDGGMTLDVSCATADGIYPLQTGPLKIQV